MHSRTSSAAPPAAPQWIRTPDELHSLAVSLRRSEALAVDSESDSLHHFPEKVCLIQLATPAGEVFLVDPLAVRDLSALAPVFADAAAVKILHGAAYDLASMKRDFGFEFAGLFDTMLAAQFLGMRAVGLTALLREVLGITSGESRQKDDWAARPLSSAQEQYAAEDVRHLMALRGRLLESLTMQGRDGWVAEECRVLETTPAAARVFRPEDCFTIKGAAALDRRGLAVLRELFVDREAWAHASGRPPFRVMGNDILARLAAERPTTESALARIPGCTATVLARHGADLLRAIARGLTAPEAALPILRRPKKPRLAQPVALRIAALTAWRTEAASRFGLDAGLLLPRRLIERLAEAAPFDRVALEAVDGIRRWRVAALGQEILAALATGRAPAVRPQDGHAPSLKREGEGAR